MLDLNRDGQYHWNRCAGRTHGAGYPDFPFQASWLETPLLESTFDPRVDLVAEAANDARVGDRAARVYANLRDDDSVPGRDRDA